MSFFNQFQLFDPKSGNVPTFPFISLPSIAVRARSILSSRTKDQIVSAAYGIDYVLDEFFSGFKKDLVEKTKASEGPWYLTPVELEDSMVISYNDVGGEVEILRACINDWDDIAGEDFPGALPQDLFAVLSLWLLADVVSRVGKGNKYPLDTASALIAGDYALKAMDAVLEAEDWRDSELTEDKIRERLEQERNEDEKKRSMRAEALNLARHRKTNEAKYLATKWWSEDPSKYRSAENAGGAIADLLSQKGFDYEPRTVTHWIRMYKRANVKGLE